LFLHGGELGKEFSSGFTEYRVFHICKMKLANLQLPPENPEINEKIRKKEQ
jgi:hypothetical protein